MANFEVLALNNSKTQETQWTREAGSGLTWQSGNWAIWQLGGPSCVVAESHLCNGGLHLPQECNEVSRCFE